MGKLLKEFQEAVPRELLEDAEARITSALTPTDDEVYAIRDVLNAVAIDFYLSHVNFTSDMPRWEVVAAANSAIEQGLRDFPKCLSCFKIWVVQNIGLPVISEAGSEVLPDYITARRLLYVDWFEVEAERIAQKG